MARKSKLRFYAEIDGKDVELFNVVDRAKAGIVINSAFPKYFEDNDGILKEFVEQHYSVHPKSLNNSVTITQKTVISINGKQDSIANSCVVNCGVNKFLHPVFARRLPELKGESRRLHLKGSDKSFKIARFNWKSASLFFVSSLQTKICIYRKLKTVDLKDSLNFSTSSKSSSTSATLIGPPW